MISLYTNSQISRIDKITIDSGTSSLALIHSASFGFVSWLLKFLHLPVNVHVISGPGNNGADGYQVAIYLAQKGHKVTVFSLDIFTSRSDENRILLKKIIENKEINHVFVKSEEDLPNPDDRSILIDALLGNGISRPLDGLISSIVHKLNSSYDAIYGLDVPSGLLPFMQKTEHAFKCKATCSFGTPKFAFFAAENEKFVGKWDFIDIGLLPQSIHKIKSSYFLIEREDVRLILKPRSQFAHKGMMGKALNIIAKNHMMGATILSAKACITLGAGYTFLYQDSDEQLHINNSIPEAIILQKLSSQDFKKYDVIGCGPGLGKTKHSRNLVNLTLQSTQTSLVLDADALNIIAEEQWHEKIPSKCILTPHIKEFERLFGPCDSHSLRVESQKEQSLKYGIYIILKGRYTSISTPEGNIYYNRTGNPGLAKGGSGDVLTGMIIALIAQGYLPFDACLSAVYLHGHAADLFVRDHHEMTLNPTELISYLPQALTDTLN